MLKINSSVEMEMKYDSLYSGLVSINKSLGGTQSMPDSEYGAMIDLMETLSGQPVGESGDAFDAVSNVATMAENGELPIQSGGSPSGCKLGDESTSVTSNGTYRWDAVSFGLDGFSSFQLDVNVPTDGGGGSDDKSWWYENGMTFAQSSITSIPSWFEPDRVIRGYRFFDGAINLATIGDLVFSNIFDAQYMFNQAVSLRTIGSFTINHDNCAAYGLFSQCGDLSSIGSLNMKPDDCRCIFQRCEKLQSVPLFDTSSTLYISSMFNGCSSLTTIPLFDFSSAKEAIELFSYCTSLKTIPQFNFSKLQQADSMFADCTALESIPELDFGNVRAMNSLFGWSDLPNLTTIGGFRNLKANCYNLISGCPNLTVDSLMNIINNLWDWSDNTDGIITFEDGTTYEYGIDHTLGMGETNLAKLTDEQKAVATNKGWQLS